MTAAVITSVMISLQDTLSINDLEIRMATFDAAGCNWLSFGNMLSTHTHRDALPSWISNKYPDILDCDVRCLMKDLVTMQWCIFIRDMPHLTKNMPQRQRRCCHCPCCLPARAAVLTAVDSRLLSLQYPVERYVGIQDCHIHTTGNLHVNQPFHPAMLRGIGS